mmetsp:Transcript_48000/g.127189  ORF Transcript_48000/g.127189 Transcript_48000/m.127189 type:complete len:118 (+) Transcript_48000:134-487(+)
MLAALPRSDVDVCISPQPNVMQWSTGLTMHPGSALDDAPRQSKRRFLNRPSVHWTSRVSRAPQHQLGQRVVKGLGTCDGSINRDVHEQEGLASVLRARDGGLREMEDCKKRGILPGT